MQEIKQFNISQKIKDYKITPRKSLGKNFIFDENILRKIVKIAGDLSNVDVLEIGSGPGGLTRAILEKEAKKVFAIEKDERFKPILTDLAFEFPEKLSILITDALYKEIWEITDAPSKIIANLPYQISTALLTKWLKQNICKSKCKSLTLMFQKEVAKRIVASPGTRIRSKLSLITELYTNAKIAFNVPADCFIPTPKVDSSLVHFDVLREPRYKFNAQKLNLIISLAFNQKRKMLKSSLKKIYPDTKNVLNSVGIEETHRPETIELKKFCDLSLVIH